MKASTLYQYLSHRQETHVIFIDNVKSARKLQDALDGKASQLKLENKQLREEALDLAKREESAAARLENLEDQLRDFRDIEKRQNSEIQELRNEKIELDSRLTNLLTDQKAWKVERKDFLQKIEDFKRESKQHSNQEAEGMLHIVQCIKHNSSGSRSFVI